MSESTSVNPWTPDQMRFQAWLALPAAERMPKSQQALAKEIGTSEETLCRWKKLPGWHDAVYDLVLSEVKAELGPVLQAHAKLARKDLDSAKWFFEVTGAWVPKQKHDVTTRVEITEIETVLPTESA